uniref:Uncharacterized protein n=1 Tax=Kalanchoe fedtschenkoi TaxID=63787 RepID=A0A7N0UV19_KALFE
MEVPLVTQTVRQCRIRVWILLVSCTKAREHNAYCLLKLCRDSAAILFCSLFHTCIGIKNSYQ